MYQCFQVNELLLTNRCSLPISAGDPDDGPGVQ